MWLHVRDDGSEPMSSALYGFVFASSETKPLLHTALRASVRWRTKSKLLISVIFGCLDKRHQDPKQPRQVCRVLTVKGGHNPLLATIQRHLPERSA